MRSAHACLEMVRGARRALKGQQFACEHACLIFCLETKKLIHRAIGKLLGVHARHRSRFASRAWGSNKPTVRSRQERAPFVLRTPAGGRVSGTIRSSLA